MNLIYHELNRLIDDYFNCNDLLIKEMILSDIHLLSEAILID